MKNKTLIIALIILSLFCSPAIIPAQQENPVAPVQLNESGILVEIKTETEPPQTGNQFEARGITTIKGKRNVTHRIFVDQTSGATFGYDLEVEPSSLVNHFMLSIKPLSTEKINIKSLPVKTAPVTQLPVKKLPVSQMPVETNRRAVRKPTRAENNQNPTKVSESNAITITDKNETNDFVPLDDFKSPKYPPAFLIEDGGMFALDVLINPQTGVKIVDFIKISSEAKRNAAKVSEVLPVRDFSPDAAELTVKNFKLQINEQTILGAENPVRGGVSGAIIWIYLPGRGRFIFSLVPREEYGFQKIGMVQDNKISFQIAGDRYEWISAAPIFSGGWNLWVLHDTDYSPQNELSSSSGGYQIGASDRIEYLLKKK